jgi:hypothetical protein
MIVMETKSAERLWKSVMEVAVAMKKEGIDIGDAVQRLRDAKVLLNHCIYDEHTHLDELFEAELEIGEIQTNLQSILEGLGRVDDFSFDTSAKPEKSKSADLAPISKLPKNKTWARIRVPGGVDMDAVSKNSGVEIIGREGEMVTLAGDKTSIQKALEEISKVFR